LSKPIEQVVAETFRISPGAVIDTLAFNGIPEWDSLAHMDLMLALEATYGVTIDEDQMLELISVRAIREFLRDGATGA
jgi:acyl carrier protein